VGLTNAEKQKRYRSQHYGLDSEAGYVEGVEILHRLQTNLNSVANANLKRLVKKTGNTRRRIIEEAINDLAERLGCNYDG